MLRHCSNIFNKKFLTSVKRHINLKALLIVRMHVVFCVFLIIKSYLFKHLYTFFYDLAIIHFSCCLFILFKAFIFFFFVFSFVALILCHRLPPVTLVIYYIYYLYKQCQLLLQISIVRYY